MSRSSESVGMSVKEPLQTALGLLQFTFRASGGIESFILHDTASVGFYDEGSNGSSRIKRISRIPRQKAKLQLSCDCYYHRGTEDTENGIRLVVTRPRPLSKSVDASIVFETAPASVGSVGWAVFKTPFRLIRLIREDPFKPCHRCSPTVHHRGVLLIRSVRWSLQAHPKKFAVRR